MKYLKKFQTNADYQAFKESSDWVTPNVSLIEEKVSGNDINIVFQPFVKPTSDLITFYIDDQVDVITMKALPGITWEEFVNSKYANQNSMINNFRLFNMGSYNGIMFYHEEAMQDLVLYHYIGVYEQNVCHTDIIEDGKTYKAWF